MHGSDCRYRRFQVRHGRVFSPLTRAGTRLFVHATGFLLGVVVCRGIAAVAERVVGHPAVIAADVAVPPPCALPCSRGITAIARMVIVVIIVPILSLKGTVSKWTVCSPVGPDLWNQLLSAQLGCRTSSC